MFEIPKLSTLIGQLVRPAAFEPRDRQFESRSGPCFAEIAKNKKTNSNQEYFAELMYGPNGPSIAFQKCTGGDKSEFIECKASTLIPSKSTLAENDERVSEDSSNADAAVCEHEQAPSTMKISNWNGPRKL